MGLKEKLGTTAKQPAPVEETPRYLDAYQVARILGISLKHVYQSKAEYGAVKVGRHWRFLSSRLPGQPDYRGGADD